MHQFITVSFDRKSQQC